MSLFAAWLAGAPFWAAIGFAIAALCHAAADNKDKGDW